MTAARKEPGGGPELSLREDSHDTLGGVLALLAHDLRNPLAALMSNASFLSMVLKDLSADDREALDDIQLSVEALGRITDSLEVVSRDLSGRPGRPPVVITVSEALGPFFAEATRAAQSHGVRLTVVFGDAENARLLVSEDEFNRAVSAITHNGISVAPSGTEVSLKVRVQGSEVLLEIFDEGPRVDPGLRERAVSAKGQMELKATRAARYSRGLGLYVARRSALLAGGCLELPGADEECSLRLRMPMAPPSE